MPAHWGRGTPVANWSARLSHRAACRAGHRNHRSTALTDQTRRALSPTAHGARSRRPKNDSRLGRIDVPCGLAAHCRLHAAKPGRRPTRRHAYGGRPSTEGLRPTARGNAGGGQSPTRDVWRSRFTHRHAQARLGRVLRRLDSPKPWAGGRQAAPRRAKLAGTLRTGQSLSRAAAMGAKGPRDQKDTPMGRGVLFRLSAPDPGYPSSLRL
jgi:hypothetical protein